MRKWISDFWNNNKNFVLNIFVIVFSVISLNSFTSVSAAEQPSLYSYITQPTEGMVTANEGQHDYTSYNSRYGKPVNSYLFNNSNGGFTRVEYSSDKIYIEDWSESFSLIQSKELEMELPIFGGFYNGENYNFIVFGQNNTEENNSVEVMRVVKYDKLWNRVGQCSVNGANTYMFADAGSLDMSESNGKLVIHTCHEMYTYSDGLNHQANMTFVVDEGSMTVDNSWYEIMNIKYGYVSHSFNQFVEASGDMIYRMDHGDAGSTRALVLTKAPINNVTDVGEDNYVKLYDIGGESGNNDTGLSAGGLLLSDNNLLAVGNSINQESSEWNYNGIRNIFLVRTDTNLSTPTFQWLTNYNESSSIKVGNPYIVGNDENNYILWEETNTDTNRTLIRIAKVDNNCQPEKIYDGIYGRLSDCEPILTDDGTLIWYSTNGKSLSFYKLDTSKLEEYAFAAPVSLNDCSITMNEEYTFNGTAIKPEISLQYNGYTLQENVDFTMSLRSNRDPGTATVILKGKGAFEGEIEKTFTIKPIDISNYQLVLTPSKIEYDGQVHEASDVTIEVYDGNRRINTSYYIGNVSYYRATNVGEYKYTLTGNESLGYTGTLTAYLTITPKSIQNMEVTLSQNNYIYDGTEKKPSVTLTDGEDTIASTNYTVSYSDNIDAGTATVTLTGKGNYGGEISKTFQIDQARVTNCVIGEISDQEFDPAGVKPEPKVFFNEKTLQLGEDYTLTYNNNTGIGNASVTVNGKGNFTGSKNATFVIGKASVENCNITLNATSYCYTGESITPDVTVMHDSHTCVIDQDYTISYEDNINAGKAKIIISGMGNYQGTIQKEFTIFPKKIEGTIILPEENYVFTGTAITPSITIMDNENMISSEYYNVKYSDNINQGTATITISGKENYYGELTKTFEIDPADISQCSIAEITACEYIPGGAKPEPEISLGEYSLIKDQDYTLAYKDNVEIGKNASILIQGKGNFTGKISRSFTITNASISRCEITLEKDGCDYTGEQITPEIFSVMDGESELVKGQDYQISYGENINAGDGIVIITGVGNYTGETQKKFVISPKSIQNMSVLISDGNYIYNGSSQEPGITLMDGEKEIPQEYYSILYQNNIDAGQASVIVNGKGNYKGTISGTFQIEKQNIEEVYVAGTSLSTLTLSYNEIALVKGKDYEITTMDSGEQITAVIKGVGNFTGTIEKVFEKENDDFEESVNHNPSTGNTQNSINHNSNISANNVISGQSNSQRVILRGIYLSGLSDKIAAGKKIKLTAEFLPEGVAEQQIIWSSSNTKVATVNQFGIVTIKKKTGGKSVVITATAANGVKTSYRIKSMKGVVKKIVLAGKKTVKAGKALKLKAKVKATKGANKKLKWISSNTEYATVSASGKVKTKKSGKGKKVKITAMATDGSNKKKTITIQIK